MSSTLKVQQFKLNVIALNSRVNYISMFNKLRSSAHRLSMHGALLDKRCRNFEDSLLSIHITISDGLCGSTGLSDPGGGAGKTIQLPISQPEGVGSLCLPYFYLPPPLPGFSDLPTTLR